MTNIILTGNITKQGFENIHKEVLFQKSKYIKSITQRARFQYLHNQSNDELIKELTRLELHSIESEMIGTKKVIFRKEQQLKLLAR